MGLFKSPGPEEAACHSQTACCADSACAPSACVTGRRRKRTRGRHTHFLVRAASVRWDGEIFSLSTSLAASAHLWQAGACHEGFPAQHLSFAQRMWAAIEARLETKMTKRRRASFSSSQIILNKRKPGSFILFLFIFCCSSDPSRFPALLSTCVLNIGALRLSSLLVNISY